MFHSEIFNKNKSGTAFYYDEEYEIKLPFGRDILSAFLKSDFFFNRGNMQNLHDHSLAEVHIYAKGREVMKIDGEVMTVEAGEAIFIPASCYHETLFMDPSSVKRTFLVSLTDTELKKRSLPMQIIHELLLEIDNSMRSKNLFRISLYLSFILGYFFVVGNVEATKVVDQAYAISEFFSRNYNKNIHSYDLAFALGVSEKHASRLVKKYTGRSFHEELTRCRISAAEQYMKAGEYQLKDIAERVGFATYSGFWKAFRRYSTQNTLPVGEEK